MYIFFYLIAPNVANVKQAIERVYSLVLPFGRNKLIENKHETVAYTETQRQNNNIIEKTGDDLSMYRRPVEELLNMGQSETLAFGMVDNSIGLCQQGIY